MALSLPVNGRPKLRPKLETLFDNFVTDGGVEAKNKVCRFLNYFGDPSRPPFQAVFLLPNEGYLQHDLAELFSLNNCRSSYPTWVDTGELFLQIWKRCYAIVNDGGLVGRTLISAIQFCMLAMYWIGRPLLSFGRVIGNIYFIIIEG
jgi:hypothetical protein